MEDVCWYCGVTVKGLARPFSYISDTGQLEPGTFVVVPFGERNTPHVGAVTSCGAYSEEEAPYPPALTKHIVRLATAEEYAADELVPHSRRTYSFEEIIRDELKDADRAIRLDDLYGALIWADEHEKHPDERILRKAVECLELCLTHGNAKAMIALGVRLEKGRGVPRDPERALGLYKQAADAGEPGACVLAADRCADSAEALRYYTLGALLDYDARCLYKLGDRYLDGDAAGRNEAYAYRLYNRAACRCDEDNVRLLAEIRLRIGRCRLRGLGIERDVDSAYGLLRDVLESLYRLRRSPDSVAESVREARTLVAEAEALLDADIRSNDPT